MGVNLQLTPLRYAIIAGVQWTSVLFVAVGLHSCHRDLWSLVGRTWTKSRYCLDDVLVALLFSFVVPAVGVSLYIILGSPRLEYLPSTDMPRTLLQLLAWVPLAISTGVVEELVFRGYLLQQAHAYFRRTDVAICAQAVLFSLGHGYRQTPAGFFHKLLLGLCFGVLTHYRKSLFPAMISHSIFDLMAGATSLLK